MQESEQRFLSTSVAGKLSDKARISRWIAFALTDSEIEALKAEPHLTGAMHDYKWLCGVDEKFYCMHVGDYKNF